MRKIQSKVIGKTEKRRYRRRLSIRTKVNGTSECPRVCLNKTNLHLSAQVIDDTTSRTICSLATYGKSAIKGGSRTKEGAAVLGEAMGTKLKSIKISSVVFDRAGARYTGVVASFVDGMRKSGIQV